MKTMIQASTLNALMLGNFDRTISVKEFLHNANTGIGTYTGLDGEAIFEDGVAYKATADGDVKVMSPDDGVAFGTVADFDDTIETIQLSGISDIGELKDKLEPYVENNKNIFYMIKGNAAFDMMYVRSCYACKKPYPTLSQAACEQREYKYKDVFGSIIAVYCPKYVEGINLPGWHFHFLSGDKTKGGHILGLSTKRFEFKIMPIEKFELVLPQNEEFSKLDLCEDLSAKTKAVEG